MLAEMNAQNQKLKPLLDQMHPQQWLDNGAPPRMPASTLTRVPDWTMYAFRREPGAAYREPLRCS